jgi:hypothetical protein
VAGGATDAIDDLGRVIKLHQCVEAGFATGESARHVGLGLLLIEGPLECGDLKQATGEVLLVSGVLATDAKLSAAGIADGAIAATDGKPIEVQTRLAALLRAGE